MARTVTFKTLDQKVRPQVAADHSRPAAVHRATDADLPACPAFASPRPARRRHHLVLVLLPLAARASRTDVHRLRRGQRFCACLPGPRTGGSSTASC
jgi:hypothetical protein